MGFYRELIIPKYLYIDYLVIFARRHNKFSFFLMTFKCFVRLPTLSTIIKPMDRILFQIYFVKIMNVFRRSTFFDGGLDFIVSTLRFLIICFLYHLVRSTVSNCLKGVLLPLYFKKLKIFESI